MANHQISKYVKAISITAEQYLRDQLSKNRKMKDIIKSIENQKQHNDTNIHSDKDHNRPTHSMPFTDTAYLYAEAVNNIDSCSETNSGNVDNVSETFHHYQEEKKMRHAGNTDSNRNAKQTNIMKTLSEHIMIWLCINPRDLHTVTIIGPNGSRLAYYIP